MEERTVHTPKTNTPHLSNRTGSFGSDLPSRAMEELQIVQQEQQLHAQQPAQSQLKYQCFHQSFEQGKPWNPGSSETHRSQNSRLLFFQVISFGRIPASADSFSAYVPMVLPTAHSLTRQRKGRASPCLWEARSHCCHRSSLPARASEPSVVTKQAHHQAPVQVALLSPSERRHL